MMFFIFLTNTCLPSPWSLTPSGNVYLTILTHKPLLYLTLFPPFFVILSSIPQGMFPLFPKQMYLCAFFPRLRFSQSPLFVPFSFPSLLVSAFPSYPSCFYWFCRSVLNIFLFISLPTMFLIFNLGRKLSGGENFYSRRELKGKHTNNEG